METAEVRFTEGKMSQLSQNPSNLEIPVFDLELSDTMAIEQVFPQPCTGLSTNTLIISRLRDLYKV